MTERLTETYPCNKCKVEFCSRLCYRMTRWAEIAKERLAEYETAEEEGRLFICPVRPYDDIYIIDQGIIIEASVDCYQVYVDNFYSIDASYIKPGEEFYSDYDGVLLNADNLGKVWFLTREKADKVLDKLMKRGKE